MYFAPRKHIPNLNQKVKKLNGVVTVEKKMR